MTKAEEIQEFYKSHFENKPDLVIESALKLQFPKIQNLIVQYGDIISITFDNTGDYTKDEVENFINTLKL